MRCAILLAGFLLSGVAAAMEAPIARIYHSMLELRDGRILMFGGVPKHGFDTPILNDTWTYEFSNSSWNYVAKRQGGNVIGAAYDKQSDRVVTLNYEGETWVFDPANAEWRERTTQDAPSGRCGHRMAYDAQSDRIILFGGFRCTDVSDPLLNDTWTYDYESNTWRELSVDLAPPPRIYHAMVYHASADRVLVWGGRVEDSRVWAFDLESNTWTPYEQGIQPTGIRAYQGMVFEPDSNSVFTFGGLLLNEPMSFEGELLNETWSYDFARNTWRIHAPERSPSARSHHAMARHPRGILMFGGELNSPYSNQMSDEVWVLDPKKVQWTRRPRNRSQSSKQ